jgi:D-alanine-D-alanine ligase
MRDVDGPKWSFPLIVQPSQEHAGIGVGRDSIVRTKTELRAKVREMLTKYHQPALAQRFIPGREFNIGLIGGKKLRVLPPAEVDYTRLPKKVPPIMSYAAKWIETSVEFQRISVICPADLEAGLAAGISNTAAKAFRAIGGWGYGRVDIRLDEDLVPRVLEVNCNPCLDNDMGLALSARSAGIKYPDLLNLIIRAAFEGPPNDVHIPHDLRRWPPGARRGDRQPVTGPNTNSPSPGPSPGPRYPSVSAGDDSWKTKPGPARSRAFVSMAAPSSSFRPDQRMMRSKR